MAWAHPPEQTRKASSAPCGGEGRGTLSRACPLPRGGRRSWWDRGGGCRRAKQGTHRGAAGRGGGGPPHPRLRRAPRPHGWAKLSHAWLTYWARLTKMTSGSTWRRSSEATRTSGSYPGAVSGDGRQGGGLRAGLRLAPASVHRCQQRDLRALDPQAVGALVGSSLPFPGVLISPSSFSLVVPGV